MSEFQIGPLQEKWLQALEQHPERQMKCQLGFKEKDGTLKLCCLGQAELTICEYKGYKPEWVPIGSGSQLWSSGTTAFLSRYEEIGLRTSCGSFTQSWEYNDKEGKVPDLTTANDRGITWPEIAAFIRANPEKVFTHPV